MVRLPDTSRRSQKNVHFLRPRRCFLLVVITLGLWMGYNHIYHHFQAPQALLVLGGWLDREHFSAKFALQHPQLPIWVSGGSNREYSEWVFTEAGVDLGRVHLDYRAVDTVTNFTTLVDTFQSLGISNIYLITSDEHMPRALVIATIVLGSRGIGFKPVISPSNRPPEPIDKIVRDGLRALMWMATGYTGADFNPRLKSI